jgi:hypothetical protein
MNQGFRNIILITFSILLFFGFWQICGAQQELLLDYPDIPGVPKPGEAPASQELPQLIKYIYFFALGAVGFVALLAIIIGAIMYVLSAGNPTKMADAKDRILSAVLGVLLLLATVLILRTINPDLVRFRLSLEPIIPVVDGGEGTTACFCVTGMGEETFQECYSQDECNSSCASICQSEYNGCVSDCESFYGEGTPECEDCILDCPISEICRTDTSRCP